MLPDDLKDRVYLITGANAGIGRVTALEIAKRGAHVFMACRSEERARPALEAIKAESGNDKVELLMLDLASFDSIRACAAAFLERDLPLHGLINNAGLAGVDGVTKEGFELTFGVNHLGHFLLTTLLIERIVASGPGARIVNVASRAHTRGKTFDLSHVKEPTRSKTGFPEYIHSKQANVLYSFELARRLEDLGVTVYTLHPGVVASNIWSPAPRFLQSIIKLFMITNEEGAQTTLHCALSEAAGEETGLYYDKSRPTAAHPLMNDLALAKELWDKSEAWAEVTWPDLEAP